MIIQSVKVLIWELAVEVVYFPIWWYTKGLKRHLLFVWHSIVRLNRNLSLGLMFKNIGKPMFGQYDRAGRIISFFMRLLLLLTRTFVFILFSLFYILLLIAWIILPVIIVWQILRNLNSLWSR